LYIKEVAITLSIKLLGDGLNDQRIVNRVPICAREFSLLRNVQTGSKDNSTDTEVSFPKVYTGAYLIQGRSYDCEKMYLYLHSHTGLYGVMSKQTDKFNTGYTNAIKLLVKVTLRQPERSINSNNVYSEITKQRNEKVLEPLV
jgi:hypothetical protein